MEFPGGKACITGVGKSAVGRALDLLPIELGVEAAVRAVADAGLTMHDIDGLAVFSTDGGSAPLTELQDDLGLRLNWFVDTRNGASQINALWESCMAVATGRATHVLAVHASCEGSIRKRLGKGGSLPGGASAMPDRIGGWEQWTFPFAAPSMANVTALAAQRYFHEYGTTREQLAAIPLVQRANATLNPDAIYRGDLSMDQYLEARIISEPLCLFDCDIPIDFGVAVIISRSDSVSGLRRTPVAIETFSAARWSRPSLDQFDDLTTMPLRDVGQDIWTRTDVRRIDIDLAQLYDGFSFLALAWIEALGFCGKGEGGPFVEGGVTIALDGALPINTGGGQLSAGRMHGWGGIPEACTQLWGEGEARQVPNDPEVALVAAGGGLYAGAAILVRQN